MVLLKSLAINACNKEKFENTKKYSSNGKYKLYNYIGFLSDFVSSLSDRLATSTPGIRLADSTVVI